MKFMQLQLKGLKFIKRWYRLWFRVFMGNSTVIEDEIYRFSLFAFLAFADTLSCQEITEIDQWRGNT